MGNRRLARKRTRSAAGRSRLDLSGFNLTAADFVEILNGEAVANLANLRELSLSGNQLTTVPESLSSLVNLQGLELGNNRLTTVPEWLGRFANLQRLDLGSNQLAVVPEWLGRLTHLRGLSLGDNQLTAIPESFSGLANLRELRLNNNQLTAIPKSLGQLANLQLLRLDNNELRELPESLGELSKLQLAALNDNQLKAVPESFGKLANLLFLALNNNQLTAVPESLGGLAKLQELWLNNNHLVAIPGLIGLAALRVLRLQGNPLPEDLLRLADAGDHEGIRAWAGDRARLDAVPVHEAKLVIVGPGQGGKTCLIRALLGLPFESRQSTDTLDVLSTPLKLEHPEGHGKVILINTWDFAGQDQYQIVHQLFYSPRSIYVVVNLPRLGEGKSEVEARVRQIIDRAGGSARVIVVSTHRLKEPVPLSLSEDDLRRKFGEHIVAFCEVDSDESLNIGTDRKEPFGIASLRRAIAQAAASLPDFERPVPSGYREARARILRLTTRTPFVHFDEFREACELRGFDDDAPRRLALLMDAWGDISYFGGETAGAHKVGKTAAEADTCGTADLVVLRPSWLAKAMARVIDDRSTRTHGMLALRRLRELWTDAEHPRRVHPHLLKLMELFEVCYPVDGGEFELLPEFMPDNAPTDLAWVPGVVASTGPSGDVYGTVSLAYVFKREPTLAVMPPFICRTHRYGGRPDRHWKRGTFLDYGDFGQAHVSIESERVMFRVRAEYPPHLLGVLVMAFKSVLESGWHGLNQTGEVLIPCPGTRGGKACEQLFDPEILRERHRKKADTECGRCGGEFEIDRLLFGIPKTFDPRSDQLYRIVEDVGEIRKKVELSRAEAAERLSSLHAGLLDQRREAPATVTVLEEKAKLMHRATHVGLRFTLWCEHPDKPHPVCEVGSGGAGEYAYETPREWAAKVAPWVSLTLKLLKPLVNLGDATLDREFLGEDEFDGLLADAEVAKVAGSQLPSGDLDLGRTPGVEWTLRRQLRDGELRAWQKFLATELDSSHRWGDLEWSQVRGRGWYWLCPACRALFNPPTRMDLAGP